MPYTIDGIKFVPQLFYKLLVFPFGIQSTQIHINYWNNNDFIIFKNFIETNKNKIISADLAFSKKDDSFFYKTLGYSLEKILRVKRFFKS